MNHFFLISFLTISFTGQSFGQISNLKVENLYQKISGIEPTLLGENLISTGLNEFNAVFTPEMDEFYFSVRHRSDYFAILKCDIRDGEFQKPEIASFSGRFMDADPFISKDGRYLYFCSNRPTNNIDTLYDWNIWRLERTRGQWLNLTLLSFNSDYKNEMYPSVATNGNVYFHSDLESEKKNLDFNTTDIYRSVFNNVDYEGYQKIIPASTVEFPEWDPFISPDEDYLIFTSPRPDGRGGGDMYICFKQQNGQWAEPKNMGEKINSQGMDYCPSLSPDGRIFFYSSYQNTLDFSVLPFSYEELTRKLKGPQNGNGDIYFIDSNIINSLR